VAPVQQALADTITPPAVTPPLANPNPPTIPATNTVTYPVTVTLPGGSPQSLNFTYNSSTQSWSTPAGWTFVPSPLGAGDTTAEFRTTVGGTSYGITLTATPASAGATPSFAPALGAVTVAPPSVGATVNGVAVSSSVLGASTASGTIVGVGNATAPLVAGTPTTLPVGATGVTVTAGAPIVISPTTATASPGSAGGSITVTSGSAANATPITVGQYVVTIPTTPTPPGNTSVTGTIAGSSGSFGPGGISIQGISGTASYNTLTGVTTANRFSARASA
jgi:hypothetical protein